ncbi:hypothetical protein Tco_0652472 [Tanacetum coccineum]|uniref:Reverse transcriptase domain-containing protein n=1 Tax=Tanacetum coccineum TaxID=301880 RepID=A0ABQ4WXN3_9ASTR
MLTQELFKGYYRNMGPKRVALKVDIQKAYDIADWSFLEHILKGFGFHDTMINQGDPMSPYLFTMVMEVLTLIIQSKVEHISILKDVIKEFRRVVGLLPNYNKSTIIFGGLTQEEQKDILDIAPFKVEKLLIKYLGVPITSKRLGIKECKCLTDKVESRVTNWRNKSLTYIGRLMLVALVLESIHVYWASIFLLPMGVINDINRLLKNFLWNQHDGTKGSFKVAWENIKSLWYDNWSNIGTLNQFISYRDMYDERFGAKMTVSDLMRQNNWNWPAEWINRFPNLLTIQYVHLDENKKDKIMWKNKDGNLCNFMVKQAYSDLLVDEVDSERLSLAASVYLIWQERNRRIFKDEKRNVDELFSIFKDTIRLRLMSLKVKDSCAVRTVQKERDV